MNFNGDTGDGISIRNVTYNYGPRLALDQFSLEVPRARIFAILGPNGSGKSTLFRLLATLIPIQSGEIRILGFQLPREVQQIRLRQGVVFQAPSLDKKLTVRENLFQQAALYGIRGSILQSKIQDLLTKLGLADRASERCEKLSGGQRRRVELAKCLLHDPPLLILDEPSTGLDPAARIELLRILQTLRDEFGTTIVLTTHLLEEADRADEIAIMDLGKVVAQGAPLALKSSIGGDTLELESQHPQSLAADIASRFSWSTKVIDQTIRIETPEAAKGLVQLMEAFPERIDSAKIGKPSLEDVFIAKTGRRLASEGAGP